MTFGKDVLAVAALSFLLGAGVAWCVFGRHVPLWQETEKPNSLHVAKALRRRLEPFKEQVCRQRRQEDALQGDAFPSEGQEKKGKGARVQREKGLPFLMRMPDGGLKVDFEVALDEDTLEDRMAEIQRDAPDLYARLVGEIDAHIAENALAVSNRLATLSAFPEDLFKGAALENHGALLRAVSRAGEAHRMLNAYHEHRLSPDQRSGLCEESGHLTHEIQERLEAERSGLFRTLVGELGYCDGDADELVTVLNAIVDATRPCPEADEVTLLSNVVLSPEPPEAGGQGVPPE